MIVQVYGPGMTPEHSYHVHREGCPDIKKAYYRKSNHYGRFKAATREEIIGRIDEPEPTVRFFTCSKL